MRVTNSAFQDWAIRREYPDLETPKLTSADQVVHFVSADVQNIGGLLDPQRALAIVT